MVFIFCCRSKLVHDTQSKLKEFKMNSKNSKKKHNINYIKPAEPAFITRLKQQAGFVEGPSVDTKKEELPVFNEDDFEDKEDEKPVVVVMKDGDLTAEEADLLAKATKKVEAEVDNKADLTQRVIFKRKNKDSESTTAVEPDSKKEKKHKKSSKPAKSVLSFDAEEDE